MEPALDVTDRGILFLLQQDARNTTAREMADELDVSASTIRNRIDQLEETNVLEGYCPHINYEKTGFPYWLIIIVTAPPTEQSRYTEKLLAIQNVVSVRELLLGRRNLHVETVASDSTHLIRTMSQIHELGLEIEQVKIMKERRIRPLTSFAQDGTAD